MSTSPQRIVCLSAETADWLWRIGAWSNVVGVTVFFHQPADVPRKPRVSGFHSANVEQIVRLQPDLVITFSDVQATLTGALAHRGVPVIATNQRTLAEVEATLALLGRVVNRETESERLLGEFRERLAAATDREPPRPRVYFEEWNDPMISGIAWVSELIERAGGEDVFSKLRDCRAASERVVTPEQVRAANPEIIFASWCGRPAQPETLTARPGWQNIAAVRNARVHEILSEDVLQPGFRLVYGYEQIKRHLEVFKCAAAVSH